MTKQIMVIVKEDKTDSGMTVVSTLSRTRNYEDKIPSDEVDGYSKDKILNSLKSLMFLKIIIIDIGISAGDAITDILQGVNLLFDSSWNISSTAGYGIAVLVTSWLPSLVTLLHLALQYRGQDNYRNVSKKYILLLSIVFVIFFPLIPTILYIDVLFRRHKQQTNKQKLSYMETEERANEVKSITGVIESPIQLIIMFWLMLRGCCLNYWI